MNIIKSAIPKSFRSKAFFWDLDVRSVWYRKFSPKKEFYMDKEFIHVKPETIRCSQAEESSLAHKIDHFNYTAPSPHADTSPSSAVNISVEIGPNGELKLSGGLDDLAFAISSKLESIPVRVTHRHPKWQYFKNQILTYAVDRNARVYAPLIHPDLSHIPSKNSDARFQRCLNWLTHSNSKELQTVLDIGSHWGYFCHRFEEAGYRCTAIEFDTKHMYFMKKLKLAQERQFKCIQASIFDFVDKGSRNYDIVLAFSIFHHFLVNETLFQKLIRMLNQLNLKVMFFESTILEDSQMKRSIRPFQSQDEFADLILEHTSLSQKTLLGASPKGRNLYVLY